jgi:hypothetical protein
MLLPNLQTLQLSDIFFSDVSSLLQLSQLGSLTGLRLERIRINQCSTEPSTQAEEGLGQAVQQLLQSMQQLASLSLSSIKMDQGSISQLPSSLTHLSLSALLTGGTTI